MKQRKFKLINLVLNMESEFTDDNPPQWLTNPLIGWWPHVMALRIGEGMTGERHRIERIS